MIKRHLMLLTVGVLFCAGMVGCADSRYDRYGSDRDYDRGYSRSAEPTRSTTSGAVGQGVREGLRESAREATSPY